MALFAANYLMRPGFGKPGLRQLTNILPHLIATHNDVVIILLVGYRAKSAVRRRVSCSAPMPHRCAFPVHCTVSTDGAFPVAGKSVAYSSVQRCCHSQPAAPQTYSSFSSGCALQLARGGILIRTAPRSLACKAKGLGRGRFPARDARGEAGVLADSTSEDLPRTAAIPSLASAANEHYAPAAQAGRFAVPDGTQTQR
jgi:hypothetical protein